MPRRIGVFGGTFDPPHIGHLVTAVDVRDALRLDEVLMVVANEPWQKAGSRRISSATDRLAMVAAAVSDVPGVTVSDVEITRGGRSYSVDTLRFLAEAEPDSERYLVLGSDAAAGLDTWDRPDELADLARIVVVERPGSTTEMPTGFRRGAGERSPSRSVVDRAPGPGRQRAISEVPHPRCCGLPDRGARPLS